jgi:DUF971 family protein
MTVPKRVVITENRDSLTLEYEQQQYRLPAEYLRVYSPSAEVRGHGRGQEVLQHGKQSVLIDNVLTAGNYAIQIVFSDGHDSGIFSWDYLFELAENYSQNWSAYLDRLHRAGKSREPDTQVVKLL